MWQISYHRDLSLRAKAFFTFVMTLMTAGQLVSSLVSKLKRESWEVHAENREMSAGLEQPSTAPEDSGSLPDLKSEEEAERALRIR